MNALHKINVMHRDLKLPNILLHFPEMEGQDDEKTYAYLKNTRLNSTNLKVKIADLGFAKMYQDASDLSSTYCGTPINMAPEVLNRGLYNYKADIWSLGTILYELLTGQSPFKEA